MSSHSSSSTQFPTQPPLTEQENEGGERTNRILELGLPDAVLIPLTFKYTFEEGELDINKLRDSLEALLDGDFWPLRGILRGMRIILLEEEKDPEGPRYLKVVERRDLSLTEIRQDAALAHALAYDPLFEGFPVLSVRITLLVDGILLGINMSHAYGDAHTFYRLFWAAWAARYSGRPFPHTVLADRSALAHAPPGAKASPSPHYQVIPRSQIPSPPPPLPTWPERTEGGCKGVRELLHLSVDEVSSLQARLGTETRLQAVFALVWKALQASHLLFPCDMRKSERRWVPALPFGYSGNAQLIYGCFCDDVQTTPLSELAQLVKAAIDGCTVEANSELLALHQETFASGQFLTFFFDEMCVGITSWTHSELCPLFGSAKPRCLWTLPEYPRNLVCITDGEPDGLDIHGHPEEVVAFREVLSLSLQ